MARKTILSSLLLCCLATLQPCFPQAKSEAPSSIDVAVKSINGMMTSGLMEDAKKRIDSLLVNIGEQKRPELVNVLKIKNLYGGYLLRNQKYEEWEELYAWCLEQKPVCQTEDELNLLVRLFNNAGIAFKRAGRLSDSQEAFLNSTEQLKKLRNPDFILSGSVYANAANSLKQIGEFERSIEYFEQSIAYFDEFAKTSNSQNPIDRIAGPKSDALSNLALVYQSLADHQKAIKVFQQCIDFKLSHYPADINDVYSNMVISLIEARDYPKARQMEELVLKDYGSDSKKDLFWALAKLNLADIELRQSGDTARVCRDLEYLNAQIRSGIPSAYGLTVDINQMTSYLLMEQGKFRPALDKWAQAMDSVSSSGEKVLPGEIPYSLKTNNLSKFIELMNLNSNIFYLWGKEKLDISLLDQAHSRFKFTLQLIDSLRNSLRNSLELQSSQLQVSKMQKSTYDLMLELRYTLFNVKGDSSLLEDIFTTMEQSKSAVLLATVKDIEFKTSRIPKEESDKEVAIRKRLTDIQGKIAAADPSQSANQQYIRDLQEESFKYNQQMDSLKRVFRQKFPEYYQAKFDRTTITLPQVRLQLAPDQVLVQYAIAFDYLYTMTVTKSGVTLNRTAIDGKFAENVNFLLEFMKGHVESLTSAARTRFCDVSRNLFEVLLGPSSELIKGKALILVPDGSLSYLPFEALLESPPNGTRQDYRKLPYLIRNHSISYGLTATLFYHRSTRITKPTRRVLVVAPSYHLASGKISDYIRRAESGLPELKGTLLESKAIKRMTGGRLLKGEHATEAKFKSIGPKYGILHLAMHSINDRTNSLNSSLVFTPGSDDVEDGVLFGHEIYDLSLNAQLTVLSACETGSGQMSGGEGVLSFGRAFITAGCPNLIMTLWTVDDRSSRELMVNFYRSLIAGNGIANALQHSKMDYLGEVDQVHAHPHFWAGFIELGQDQVLNVSYKKPGLIVLVVFFSLSILIFVLIQIKKKSPPKRGYDGKE